MRMRSLLTPILFGAIYVAAGILTASLASSAASIEARNAWRLAAWGIGVLVYGTQLALERFRLGHTNLRSAVNVSVAVAIGALALAAWGPVRTHWGEAGGQRALTALVLWPVLMGLPSFALALVVGSVFGRLHGQRP
jgi:hypothetical protein